MPAFWQACLMVVDSAVLARVSDELQAYVYMLVDPDTGVPFYVGKGHRLRLGDHVAEALAPARSPAASTSSSCPTATSCHGTGHSRTRPPAQREPRARSASRLSSGPNQTKHPIAAGLAQIPPPGFDGP
jgi:hypothetical protein